MDSFEIIKDENLYSDDTAAKIENNIATGKSYTTSLLYRQGGKEVNWAYDENAEIAYPDKNSSELTDGYIPTDNEYKNPAWFGLHYKTPDAIESGYVFAKVDLEDKYDVTGITVYLPDADFNKESGVYGPDANNVSFYADGVKIDGAVTVTAVNDYVSAYTIEANVQASVLEVRINHGGWVFISEFAAEGTLSPDEPIYARGDVNGDGKVNMFDYLAVKSHCLGKTALTDEQLLRADLSGDGKINMFDYVALKNLVVKG